MNKYCKCILDMFVGSKSWRYPSYKKKLKFVEILSILRVPNTKVPILFVVAVIYHSNQEMMAPKTYHVVIDFWWHFMVQMAHSTQNTGVSTNVASSKQKNYSFDDHIAQKRFYILKTFEAHIDRNTLEYWTSMKKLHSYKRLCILKINKHTIP